MARFAVDPQFAADKRHSLPHAGVAKAWSSWFQGGIESNAVVVYRELESAIGNAKGDFYRAGARMTSDILKRLLCDAVQTERCRPRGFIENFLGSESYGNRFH